MTEIVPPVRVEGLPPPEASASREQVMKAFNRAAHRWEGKINGIHREINPNVEIDDLADTGRLSAQQRNQFAQFRNFQKGVRGMTGQQILVLVDSQRKDAVTTSFRNPETGEVYTREEGLDISGLIDSVREDIVSAREYISRYPSSVSYMQDRLDTYEGELRILEGSSVPYEEAFPNALDENDPVERARIAEESRRIWKNPLTSTGSVEDDKKVAVDRLRASRLLRIPAKAAAEAASTSVRAEAPVVYIEPLPKAEGDGTTLPEAAPLEAGTAAAAEAAGPVVGELGSFLTDLASRGPEAATTEAVVAGIRGIADRLGDETRIADPVIAERVATLSRIRIPQSHRGRLLLALLPLAALLLLGIGIRQRSNFDVAASNRNAAATASQAPQTEPAPIPTATAESGLAIQKPFVGPMEQNPFYKRQPDTIQGFRDGMGLLDNGKFIEADFTLRDDYRDKIDPDNKNPNIYPKEGYSVKGMVEADIAEVMNPDLQEDAERLEAEGKVLSEADPRISRTLELLKEKIDSYYGDGTFDNMISDFTERMKKAIIIANENQANPFNRVLMTPYHLYSPDEYGPDGFFNEQAGQEATVRSDSQITQGRFKKWGIRDEDFDKWFALATFNWDFSQGKDLNTLDTRKWREMRDQINAQLASEGLK